MADNIIQELEASSQVLLAPPNLVTNEQRRQAETVFMNFKKTKAPFDFCKHILETCKTEYVQFQAAVLLKEAVTREWTFLEKGHRDMLRTYLLQYVTQKPDLQSYVREEILLVVAIMVKRGTVDGSLEDREQLLTAVSQLIASGEVAMQLIGCSILSALLTEYASTVKSSDVGLTWETHFQAKKNFEATDLKRIFQFCLQALCELEKCPPPLSRETLTLTQRFLAISEQVLSWNFIYTNLPRRLIGVFETDQAPSLRPGPTWRSIILDENVIALFFNLHWKVRYQSEVCHHSINCLSQMATLQGTVFVDQDARVQYLNVFLQGLLKLITCSDIQQHESLGLATILSRLVLFFPPSVLCKLPTELVESFLLHLTNLTCYFMKAAAREQELPREDQLYMESFEKLLDCWMTQLHDYRSLPETAVTQVARTILDNYLQCHLAAPDGTRQPNSDHDADIDEDEEDDRIKFEDQLSVIGAMGRLVPEYTVPLLSRLIEERIDRLRSQLQLALQGSPGGILDSSVLIALHEDLHWLVLITGSVLAMENDGETPLIPSGVVKYSLSQSSSVNVESTLRLLATHMASEVVSPTEDVDQVVRLTAVVFHLCEVYRRALEANMSLLLSPEVGSTLMWFLRRWSQAYLMPNESYYNEMSMCVNAAFGRDSESGLRTLEFMLQAVDMNLQRWSSEHGLINHTVQLLVALVDSRDRASKMSKCESLWRILYRQASNNLLLLPSPAKRGIIKSFILAGTAASDIATKEQYWLQVLKPLQERFTQIVGQDNFSKIYQDDMVRKEIIHIMDSFIGTAQGVEIYNVSYLFPFLLPICQELVGFLRIYRNYQEMVELVLEFFCECTKRMICYLTPVQTKQVYECCLSMIQTFAKCNKGIVTKDPSAEEDQYKDVLLLMELLTNMLSKDFIDYCPEEVNDQDSVAGADITLYGLHIIMPLMNIELLRFPRLCLQYFKMITFVCEIYPDKICQLPEDLLKNMMASVEIGLTTFGSDIVTLCLDFLSVLNSHVHRAGLQGSPVYELAKPFLKVVMDMVLLQNFESDVLRTASSTLYSFMYSYQDQYKHLVQELLASQTDPIYYERLANAFNKMSKEISDNGDRLHSLTVRDNYEKFVVEVRSFLCVK